MVQGLEKFALIFVRRQAVEHDGHKVFLVELDFADECP
jgi:hypothetical protein